MPENIDLVELLIFNFVVLYAILTLHDLVKSYMLMMNANITKGKKIALHKFFVPLNTDSLLMSWLCSIVVSCLIIGYDAFFIV